jgi:uncharacterized protein YbjQ (UPF0145 family)
MGLFQHKQDDGTVIDPSESEEHFFDEYFREELRNHGRWYFEKVINENGELFKHDLEETIRQVNIDLKEHVTKQLDEAIAQVNAELKDHTTKQLQAQFTDYSKALKDAQDEALENLVKSAQQLREQHDELRVALEKNVTEQQDLLRKAFEENRTQIETMRDSQAAALQWLNQSAQAMQDQYQQIADTLQTSVKAQETAMITAFQDNMARVIEHYLLEALGDQFDVKEQLPGIIKQLESRKQDIVDDMTL